jgi:hypothetical protein
MYKQLNGHDIHSPSSLSDIDESIQAAVSGVLNHPSMNSPSNTAPSSPTSNCSPQSNSQTTPIKALSKSKQSYHQSIINNNNLQNNKGNQHVVGHQIESESERLLKLNDMNNQTMIRRHSVENGSHWLSDCCLFQHHDYFSLDAYHLKIIERSLHSTHELKFTKSKLQQLKMDSKKANQFLKQLKQEVEKKQAFLNDLGKTNQHFHEQLNVFKRLVQLTHGSIPSSNNNNIILNAINPNLIQQQQQPQQQQQQQQHVLSNASALLGNGNLNSPSIIATSSSPASNSNQNITVAPNSNQQIIYITPQQQPQAQQVQQAQQQQLFFINTIPTQQQQTIDFNQQQQLQPNFNQQQYQYLNQQQTAYQQNGHQYITAYNTQDFNGYQIIQQAPQQAIQHQLIQQQPVQQLQGQQIQHMMFIDDQSQQMSVNQVT